MTPLFLALALFQSSPEAAVDASIGPEWPALASSGSSMPGGAAIDRGLAATEAARVATEAAVSADRCRQLAGAADALQRVYESTVRQEARVRLLQRVPAAISGAERADERALGQLDAALVVEVNALGERVKAMDEVLGELEELLSPPNCF